ncbi:epoxyqueuosine reductase QueH [Candidatus Omnitrophota bacterium]
MKLLLHTCCGPCLLYPFRALSSQGFSVDGFFYNPNIYPATEYSARRDAVEKVAVDKSVMLISPEYDSQEFSKAIGATIESPARCTKCWQFRLEQTARYAHDNGYEYFSTTLLVSPYQNIAVIKTVGEKAAREGGVRFHFEDFRQGFREAHNEAKQKGVYCQNYCGCLYSQRERSQKKKKQ